MLPLFPQQQTSFSWSGMSALPPEADIRQRIEHVCFVPKADFPNRSS